LTTTRRTAVKRKNNQKKDRLYLTEGYRVLMADGSSSSPRELRAGDKIYSASAQGCLEVVSVVKTDELFIISTT
jgi:hypothetical protein